MNAAAKLGLGGHTFIEQLGNDPGASFQEQCAIVETCVEAGIQVIDTTYYQERVALGRALKETGRRPDVEIMAWNFFRQPGHENDLVPPTPFELGHLNQMLEELQTDYLDLLVVHTDDDPSVLAGELEVATRWLAEGKIRAVGLGMAHHRQLDRLPPVSPISHVLAPYNAFNRGSTDLFMAAKERGWKIIALSPFIRGWKLDEIGEDNAVVADILLRWVTSQDLVDRAIVSMRRSEWVQTNVQSVERGPLTDTEQQQLDRWIAKVPGPPKVRG